MPSRRLVTVYRLAAIASLTAALSMGFLVALQAQQSGRWLEVSRLSGSVTYSRNGTRAARVGDRLEAPGHGISTAARSSAALSMDTAIGSINVAESTQVTVRHLETLADGGRITLLDVPRGQARIQVRTFTNPSSRLELHTPSGVAAVRGTDFGIIVSENGRTAVGTEEGTVAAIAQGRTVQVEANFASIIQPGQAPTDPQPLDRELQLQLENFSRRGNQVNIQGFINPANRLLYNGEEIPIRRTGRFRATVSLPFPRNLELVVQNPLGEQRPYRYHFWQIDDPDTH